MKEETLKAAKILILDDEVSMTSLLLNFLGRVGYSCVRAVSDPTLVFPVIDEYAPDLLLLDLTMPHVHGLQVLEQLRAARAARGFPVLVLTADATPENKRKALAAGATDLLAKPFDTSEILMRIRNLLLAHFLRLEIEEQNQNLEHSVAERTQQLEQALADLKQAQDQMLRQERLHAFAEMAGGVVHDFSNTLMSVIGFSELLIENSSLLNDRETALEYLRIISTAGRDAAQVVSRLRDFYRPREQAEIFEPTDLNKLIEQAVALTQPKWKEQPRANGHAVTVSLLLEKVPPVYGNAPELREALTNLIFNAVDAMPAGGEITFATRREPDRVCLEVRDTGCGMSAEVRNRCLNPFFSTKGDKGTGLGLSMVFGIVQRHEGQLEIESEPGRGTTFRIRLPSLVRTIDAFPAEESAPARPLKLLVVEDEEVTRIVVCKFLAADGHEVASAKNGEEALARWQPNAFDVVVTDQAMPGLTGGELASTIRGLAPEQRIILLTGFSRAALGENGAIEHVNLVLNKPISRRELRRALEQVCRPETRPQAELEDMLAAEVLPVV